MPAGSEADYFLSIRKALSDPRLESFRVGVPDDDARLLARHVWNQALGAALYPTMQFLEVALRNALHDAITLAYGLNWYDDPLVVVNPIYGQPQILKAKQTVRARTRVNPPEIDRVIAELDFGFWTSLFNSEYRAGRNNVVGQKVLWPTLLPFVFTATARATRGIGGFSTRLNDLRRLRNSVSHHARIWLGRPPSQPGQAITPLNVEHQQLLETIGWLNEDLEATAIALDTFPDVFQNGFNRAETQLDSYFKLLGYR